MICWDGRKRNIIRLSTLWTVSIWASHLHINCTFGSVSGPVVCASTTLCANLMQHTRTPAVAESHIRKIRDLMAVIRSHVSLSYALLILFTVTVRHCPIIPSWTHPQPFNIVVASTRARSRQVYRHFKHKRGQDIRTSISSPEDICSQRTVLHSSQQPHPLSRSQPIFSMFP